MTQKQKTWHKIGIVFLALSLVCAVLYIWFSTQDAWAWLIGTIAGPDAEDSNPLIGFAATLAIGFTEWMGAMGGLLLSLLGTILSLVRFCGVWENRSKSQAASASHCTSAC